MQKIINPDITPPGGWSWTHPRTGFVFNMNYGAGEKGLMKLMEHVKKYCDDNLLPTIQPVELRRLIENEICKRDGMAGRCMDAFHVGGTRAAREYLSGAMAGAKTIIARITGDHERNMVNPRLANRRAAVCLNCPLHVKPDENDATLMEKFTDAVMLKMIGSRRTERHDELMSCAACTCCMRAKVWFSRKTIAESLDKKQIEKMKSVTVGKNAEPMVCWHIKEA